MSSQASKTALITEKPHEPDFLCEYGICYSGKHTNDLILDRKEYKGLLNDSVEEVRQTFIQGVQETKYDKIFETCETLPQDLSITAYLCGIAENPNLTMEELENFIEGVENYPTKSAVLTRIAKRENLNEIILHKLTIMENFLVLAILAERADLPDTCQQILANSKNPSIENILLENPNIKDEHKVWIVLNERK